MLGPCTKSSGASVVQPRHLPCVCSVCSLQPAAAHLQKEVPNSDRHRQASSASDITSASDRLHAFVQGTTGLAAEYEPPPWRADSMRVMATLEHASVALVDDRYGNNIEVLALQLQVGDPWLTCSCTASQPAAC